jgi:hypothetical protein
MNAKQLKAEFDTLATERSNWNPLWQVLGEYVSQIKQNFETQPANGEFLTKEIFDANGAFAAHNAASALLGMLWPATAKQAIEIKPPDDLDMDTELSQFYERMTNRTVRAMDDPRANLSLSLDEYMLDEIIFGTAGVGVEAGDESKLLFKPYGVKELYIDEGKNGKVDKVYLCYEWTVGRVVDEYGLENVSPKVAEKFRNDKTRDKVKILHIIKKRRERKAIKGKLAMPYMSVHMEYGNCHVMREDGFHELPIFVGRFRKLLYELYGRSPAMNALPDIREANVLREAFIIGTEKALDMPIGVMDDGMLGGGYIDTSAKAINVFNASGNLGGNQPVFEIGKPPNLAVAEARLEKLNMNISQHFHIDKLLDFNNQTQMTFGEAQIRDQIRTASLSSLFSRQIAEVFTPLIERSVNILWRAGEFGVLRGSIEEQELMATGKEPEYIPDALVERLERGEEIYTINYKTKAANASRAEEYIAIIDVTTFAAQAAAVDPSVTMRVNMHEAVKNLADIRALPVGIIRQDDEVEAMQQQQAQAQAAQQALMTADAAAGVADKAASAEMKMRQAQAPV